MRTIIKFLVACILYTVYTSNTCCIAQVKQYTISSEVVIDKIRGGLLGQILGNINGMPHEMQYLQEPGDVYNYTPSLPDGAFTDDDTDFEWVYVMEMQRNRNVYLSPTQINRFWKERINSGIWCANRYARHLMDIGIQSPLTGNTLLNPWAEFNVSGQFLCETYGLICPGMPQTASKISLNKTLVAIDGEPAQTTQLFSTMIAMAFVEKNMNTLLDHGMMSLDKNCKIRCIIIDVREWHAAYPEDWKKVRQLIKEKYSQDNQKMRDMNGYELNTAAIIASLLYGKGDFAETLKHSFNFGWDADCNAATVGTILGVQYGYRKMMCGNTRSSPNWQIVDRYKNTRREAMPNDETITSFADRIIELFEMVNLENGGAKVIEDNKVVFKIALEKPAMIKNINESHEAKEAFLSHWESKIKELLRSSCKEERARATYMAICLDIAPALAKSAPKLWETACHDLSGYWKVMNNLFYGGDFNGLNLLKQKFTTAGFKTPRKGFYESDIYNDTIVWKNPIEIYN